MRPNLVMLLAVCACGGESSGTVTIYAYKDYDTPAANVSIVASSADGTLVGSAKTGADGRVTVADVPAGGAITLAFDDGQSKRLGTVFGVQPGDQLTIRTTGSDDITFNSLSVNVPAYTGAQGYEVANGCRRQMTLTPGTQRLDVLEWCVTPDRTVGAVAYALGGTGDRLAYAIAPDVAVVPAATPPPTITGTLGPWATDLVTVDVRLTPLPGAPDADFAFRRGGARRAFDQEGNVPVSGTLNYRAYVPPGFFDEVIVSQSINGSGKAVLVSRDVPPGNVQVEIDLSAIEIATVDAMTLDGSGTARPTLRWQISGQSSAEMTVGSVAWQGGSWTFIAPPDARAGQVPELPVDLAAYSPTGPSLPFLLGVIDHSHLASYDEARQRLRETILMAEGERCLKKGGTVTFSARVTSL